MKLTFPNKKGRNYSNFHNLIFILYQQINIKIKMSGNETIDVHYKKGEEETIEKLKWPQNYENFIFSPKITNNNICFTSLGSLKKNTTKKNNYSLPKNILNNQK